MSVLSTILTPDQHADIIVRSVAEGSITRERARQLGLREGRATYAAVLRRLAGLEPQRDRVMASLLVRP